MEQIAQGWTLGMIGIFALQMIIQAAAAAIEKGAFAPLAFFAVAFVLLRFMFV